MRRASAGAVAFALALCAPFTTSALHAQVERAANPELRAELQAAVDTHQLPGATVLIARGGKLLANVTVGWNDIERRKPLAEDSIFRLFSMSKPITSVAVMMLAERGKLRLDDPVEKYLPELANLRVYVSGDLDHMVTEPVRRPMTIANLLTHSSGITYHFTGNTPVHQYYRKYGVMRDTPVGRLPTDGPPARSLDELVARIGKAPLLHQPGTEFAYSYSTTVLGAVIERASGTKLDRFLADNIFRPLGMTDTGFFISDAQLPRFTTLYSAAKDALVPIEQPATSDYRDHSRLLDGGGAIAGTARDYLRFAEMLANGGTLEGHRILKQSSVDAMMTPRVRMAGLGSQTMWFGYGFSIGDAASAAAGMQPDGTASWSGSGNTYFFIDRRKHLAAVLMTHVLNGQRSPTSLARGILNREAARLAGN